LKAPCATISAQLPWIGGSQHQSSVPMAEIVNLRIARKRAARGQAENRAAEARLTHGASKSERVQSKTERARLRRTLDRHRIEKGDDR
jgi:Domain of unknown function (DUF4169)